MLADKDLAIKCSNINKVLGMQGRVPNFQIGHVYEDSYYGNCNSFCEVESASSSLVFERKF